MNGAVTIKCHAFAALALSFILAITAHAAHVQPAPPNVILIISDALRADHLSCYGYQRNTTPFIDTLAAQGIRFERAASCSTLTPESVTALYTGRTPSSSGRTGGATTPNPDKPNIAKAFHDAGYRTAFLSDTFVLAKPDFTQGLHFDTVVHSTTLDLSAQGMKLTENALSFVNEESTKPFFAYLHYLDPHGPYEPPEAYYRRFATQIFPHPIDLYAELRPNCQKYLKEGFGPGDPRYDDLILRYDAEIAFIDDAVNALVKGLKAAGRLDNTLIIFTSDHGEEFLEHQFVEHAWTVYEESTHVPLILWNPTTLPPAVISDRVSLADLAPTILTFACIPFAPNDFDGIPLIKSTADGKFTPAQLPTRPRIAELLADQRNLVRSIILGDWKYITAMKWWPPEKRDEAVRLIPEIREGLANGTRKPMDIWGPVIHEELYNLVQDPGETHNLYAPGPDLDRMRQALDDYRARCQSNTAPPESQAVQPQMNEQDLERLRAIGYLDAPTP